MIDIHKNNRRTSVRTCQMAALALLLNACSGKPPPPPDVSVPVSTIATVKKSMPDLINAIGTVEAINSVSLKSLVDGQLLESRVKDGDEVKAGQLLLKIDPRPAQAALAQSQAALAKDAAASDLAHAQVERYQPVANKGFISADQMQQYLTAYTAAAASVKVDQANVDAAKLTLGYTDIFAPISGRIGRLLVQPGNLVKANDTNPLLVLNQISPIFVNFAIPGSLVDRVRAAHARNPLVVQASGNAMASTQNGELAFVDNAVDPSTNTVKLRASFVNAEQQLWPGQFVTIELTLGTDAEAIVVPDAAVKAGPNGSYVFVIKSDGRAEQRTVTVLRTVEGESVVTKGLAVGENVVTDGQSRLIDGTKVRLANAGTDANGSPANAEAAK